MFELTISASIEKQKYIDKIFKELSSEIKTDGGIAAMQNHSSRSSFAMAVPAKKKEYYKSKVLEFIISMITDDYKFNFYKEKIRANESSIIFESFLKAISIFDSDTDREFIKSQLEFSGEILVDSFYFFKLQPLRAKWGRTADIINQNQILQSKSSMLEVLKYLTAMSENYASVTNIVVSPKQIKLLSNMKSKNFKRNFEGMSGFLTEVVKLNPVKINLKVSETAENNDDIVDVINRIFTDKVYLTN